MVVVRHYTGDAFVDANIPLRRTLPDGGRGRMPAEPEQAFILTLRRALAKLPRVPGTTYRGVDLDPATVDKYQVGTIHTEPHFLSTSKLRSRAYRGNAQFVIRGRSGRDIEMLSKRPEQREVLFGAYTAFRVAGREDRIDPETGSPYVRIELEEVGDDG